MFILAKMTNYQDFDDETELAMLEENELTSEQEEIMKLQQEFEQRINQSWKMIPANQIDERLLKLKTLNEH